MTTSARTLFDDVFAVFRRACKEQQFHVADQLLATLELMADKDDLSLDEVYLSFACPGGAGGVLPAAPARPKKNENLYSK
ncbi:hypothetical protein [Cupriavidus metallidurans]|uniref:hypothetical protein n=1 Tax=Cupriavidus metallidurans TaxID=119219 RepID=UPI001319F5F6|nr:hypothetical protein [Cupriavidus metallidurans]